MATRAEEKESTCDEENGKTEEPPKNGGCKTICRKAVQFIFSTAGLFLINFAYLVMGASIFTRLEKPNEEQTCFTGAENFARAENVTTTLMLGVATRIANGAMQSKDGDVVVREDYTNILQSFSLSVVDIGYNISKNCSQLGEPGGPQYAWSWTGSLAFAMTVTTTIGYGVIAPKTPWGRLVCIAYAILGLPIMLICLANVGDVMADIFRFAYATVCCCGCCRPKSKKDKQNDTELTPVTTWRTDSTGRPIIYDDEDDSDEEDDDEEEEDDGEITVPLTISMIVLFSFIFLGAALFYVWEPTWSFLDALYFCFITFSTIGFGDIVPGTGNIDSPESQAQLLVSGLYQILGMAMVSMCFQLMQDEIVAKVRWILLKLGVGKKNDKDKLEEIEVEQTEQKQAFERSNEESPARPKTAIRKTKA